ncbi:hypothetical protein LTR86_006251 [Recurvomyces mirabilis]|nr:hypothetical protein LTR86_006251 [Recurvomyces mirabilis]
MPRMQCPPTPQEDRPINGLPPPRNSHHSIVCLLPGLSVRPPSFFHNALSSLNRDYHDVYTALNDGLIANQRFAAAEVGLLTQNNGLREDNSRLEKAKEDLETELKTERETLGAENVVLGAEVVVLKEDLEVVLNQLKTRDEGLEAARKAHETCEQAARDLIADNLEAALASKTTLEQTANGLRDQLKTQKDDLATALRTQKDLEGTTQELGQQLEKTENELTTALAGHEMAKQAAEDLTAKLNKSQSAEAQAREEVQRLESNAEECAAKLKTARREASSMRNDYATAVQQVEEEKKTALATMRSDLDEQMDQLKSDKIHESQERKLAQHQLATERTECAEREKRLRAVRLQLAGLEAVDRAARVRSKVLDMSLTEPLEVVRDHIAVHAHILALVCRRDRGERITTTSEMWTSLADSLARDQEQRSRMLATQNLEQEVQTAKQETRKYRDLTGRLQRAILVIMRDGPEKEKLAVILEELASSHCSGSESAATEISPGNEASTPSQTPPSVSTSDKRKTDAAGLIDENEPKRKKVRGIKPPWAYRESETRKDDLTDVQQHSLLFENDIASAYASTGSYNSSNELEVQDSTSAAAKASDDLLTQNEVVTSGKSANTTAMQPPPMNKVSMAQAHEVLLPSPASSNSPPSSQPPPANPPSTPPPCPPQHSPPTATLSAPSSTSRIKPPPAAHTTLPPPQYETPRLPPPPDDIPRYQRTRVSFSIPPAREVQISIPSTPRKSSLAQPKVQPERDSHPPKIGKETAAAKSDKVSAGRSTSVSGGTRYPRPFAPSRSLVQLPVPPPQQQQPPPQIRSFPSPRGPAKQSDGPAHPPQQSSDSFAITPCRSDRKDEDEAQPLHSNKKSALQPTRPQLDPHNHGPDRTHDYERSPARRPSVDDLYSRRGRSPTRCETDEERRRERERRERENGRVVGQWQRQSKDRRGQGSRYRYQQRRNAHAGIRGRCR